MNSSEAQTAGLVGSIIAGKYRVDGVLGAGGMGIVLSATHIDLDRLVAVKLMRSELREHPQAVERLLREARLAAQFRGDHMCRVLDVGLVSDGTPYIVMEYLEGSDLSAVLAQHGPLDVDTAVDFMLEASEALAEAHSAGVVHRDLKPENLFVARQLDGSPTIKVLDFGISKQIGSLSVGRALTNPSVPLGSPFYMAPEQMRSAREVDARADLWALGAILYELLSGRQAFNGDSLPEVCGAVMNDIPQPVTELRPEVPSALSAVIARCLEKDREQRFATIVELAAALVPFGSGAAEMSLERIERVLARRPGTPTPGHPSLPSHPSAGRYTPSGARGKSTTPAVLPAPGSHTSLATSIDNPSPPKRIPWIASILALLVLAGSALWFARRSDANSARASLGAAAADSALKKTPAVPEPVQSVAATEPPAAAPLVPSATSVEASPAAVSTHAPSHQGSRQRAGVARPASFPPASPALSTPAAPAAKKVPDAAAAWDPNSFGPRR